MNGSTTTHNLKHEPKSKEVIAAQIVDLLDGNMPSGQNAQIDEAAIQNIAAQFVEYYDNSTLKPRLNNAENRLNDNINHVN